MKAPVRHELNTPLAVHDVDDPSLATGHKRPGICGSDPLATIKLEVSLLHTSGVGFMDFLEALESVRTPSAQHKIMLD